MKLEVYSNADAVAQKAAAFVAADARAAVVARGAFVMAVSGGHTPWEMLRALAGEDVPWDDVHVVQVDERVAPTGDPDRNLTHLHESLVEHAPLRPERIHAMPVVSSSPASARSICHGVCPPLTAMTKAPRAATAALASAATSAAAFCATASALL